MFLSSWLFSSDSCLHSSTQYYYKCCLKFLPFLLIFNLKLFLQVFHPCCGLHQLILVNLCLLQLLCCSCQLISQVPPDVNIKPPDLNFSSYLYLDCPPHTSLQKFYHSVCFCLQSLHFFKHVGSFILPSLITFFNFVATNLLVHLLSFHTPLLEYLNFPLSSTICLFNFVIVLFATLLA
jgi:hypothetical protein